MPEPSEAPGTTTPLGQRAPSAPVHGAGSAGARSSRIRSLAETEWTGQLRLGVAERDGRSYAARQFHEGALRVLRPHYLDHSGQVTYTVINPGGAYFGADAYLLDVVVERGASLALTTQSATKVYRTPQGPATQEMTVRLGPGSVLDYVPDQLIVYREGFVGKAAGLDLSLDDRFVAQLKSPRFTAVSVAPGGHQLSMAFGGLAGKQNKPTLEGFIAAPGEVIAFRATMQMGMTKNRIVVDRISADQDLVQRLKPMIMIAPEA